MSAPNKFAKGTTVSIDKTRMELERLLEKYGVQHSVVSRSPEGASIQFVVKERWIRFVLAMPSLSEFVRGKSRGNYSFVRSADAAAKARDQACRELWRALLLVIKAKLEAVQCGIATIEQEFLAWIVTKDNRTIGERLLPEIDQTVAKGPKMMMLLEEPHA